VSLQSPACLPPLPPLCSFIYLSGKLRPVPASRAELFADKALPLAAKRCLGRFLAACVEAQQGCSRLKVSALNRLEEGIQAICGCMC
jgi:RAB protein geranylgeranyltransferase component A